MRAQDKKKKCTHVRRQTDALPVFCAPSYCICTASWDPSIPVKRERYVVVNNANRDGKVLYTLCCHCHTLRFRSRAWYISWFGKGANLLKHKVHFFSLSNIMIMFHSEM